ncbi:cytochrome P450 [Achaetomium macrosporum]|uniref:Cytochrome P450 n=1 Tax=Achaetomium macrosporum TaxID=79813 RepID=A0AAN7C634_9PEZI|nr:cytochrome P450 [Achaetomium macrosporum]
MAMPCRPSSALPYRKVLQPPFIKSRVGQYAAMQRMEALVCCKSIMDSPNDWLNALRRFSVVIVLTIAYGLEVDEPNSPWVQLADDAANAIAKSGAPASSSMGRSPALRKPPEARYFPDWPPSMERLRYGLTSRSAIENITSLPFEASLKHVVWAVLDTASGAGNQSFAHGRTQVWQEHVQKGLPNELDLVDIRGQRQPSAKRSEADRVVGNGRLPTWDGIPNFPYTSLVLQETYRMNLLSPLGIPHASVADDEYNGMFIPKGTIVYQNVWAWLHDEYLPKEQGGNGEPLPVGDFRFGRRRNPAENSLLIMLVTILATVGIDRPLGEDGKPGPFRAGVVVQGSGVS